MGFLEKVEQNDELHHFIRIMWILELYFFLALMMVFLPRLLS